MADLASGTVRLGDITFVPDVYNQYFMRESTERLAILANLVVNSPELNMLANTDNVGVFNMPYMDYLDGDSDQSSDNPLEESTPTKLGEGVDKGTIIHRTKTIARMDRFLMQFSSGPDPFGAMIRYMATYWSHERQKILIKMLKALTASNIANYSSDAVYNLASVAGTNATYPAYDSYLIMPAAFGVGFKNVPRPLEYDRKVLAGNGSGMDYAVSRHSFILHPNGWSYALNSDNPSYTTIEDAATWERTRTLKESQRFVTIRSNVAVAGGGDPDAGNILDATGDIAARQKLGDYKDGFVAIVMHSAVEAALESQDLIETLVPQSMQRGGIIKTFRGLRVITDDSCPSYTSLA